MATHFVHAGPVTTISVTHAAGKYVLMQVKPNREAWLTVEEARELADRLNALADSMAVPRNTADVFQLSLEEQHTEK